jgi:hypothetical protein
LRVGHLGGVPAGHDDDDDEHEEDDYEQEEEEVDVDGGRRKTAAIMALMIRSTEGQQVDIIPTVPSGNAVSSTR